MISQLQTWPLEMRVSAALAHPEFGRLLMRLVDLRRRDVLTDGEGFRVECAIAGLENEAAAHWLELAALPYDEPIPDPGTRPSREAIINLRPGPDALTKVAGYFHRCRVFCEKLEAKYGTGEWETRNV